MPDKKKTASGSRPGSPPAYRGGTFRPSANRTRLSLAPTLTSPRERGRRTTGASRGVGPVLGGGEVADVGDGRCGGTRAQRTCRCGGPPARGRSTGRRSRKSRRPPLRRKGEEKKKGGRRRSRRRQRTGEDERGGDCELATAAGGQVGGRAKREARDEVGEPVGGKQDRATKNGYSRRRALMKS